VTNTAGRITDVNERALSLTGFSRQWLVGMELVGLFADRRRAAEVIEQSYNEKLVHDVELELLTNDAETIPISLSASLYLD